MSSIYKRKNSPYWQWKTYYRGRKITKSTHFVKKRLAMQVKEKWDSMLINNDLSFLGLKYSKQFTIDTFIHDYLKYISTVKSHNTYIITRGTLNRFHEYLKGSKIVEIKDITIEHIELYLLSLNLSAKTKKNHLNIISLMLKRAMRMDILQKNVAELVDKPKGVAKIRHRLLDGIDLQIIFRDGGHWQLYYEFLYYTGLRAGDVARLKYESIDFEKQQLTTLIKKSRRIHRFPIAESLIDKLDHSKSPDEPIFPELYSEDELRINYNISKPRKYMQALLKVYGHKKATLHSFRVTFNNIIRDLGYGIYDRQKLLAHSASEVTKIYTHPNEKLAMEIVNKIPAPMEVKDISVGYSVG